jgi:demethylmenaquinone methyltransferase/2-methoxy-6-polyprenyl-1,4-benzoquinol methylase
MFGRIAPRYDLLNTFMSLRQAQRWRRTAVEWAALPSGGLALDVATGTGDLALELALTGQGRVIALDVSAEMLARARGKIGAAGRAGSVDFVHTDAHALPFPDGTFTCATVAFGIRNFANPRQAFAELRRVVQRDGRVVCLELLRPSSGVTAAVYLWSLQRIVPALGQWMAGDEEPYRYLVDSLRTFMTADQLQKAMEEAGLHSVRYRIMNWGTVAVHVGVR